MRKYSCISALWLKHKNAKINRITVFLKSVVLSVWTSECSMFSNKLIARSLNICCFYYHFHQQPSIKFCPNVFYFFKISPPPRKKKNITNTIILLNNVAWVLLCVTKEDCVLLRFFFFFFTWKRWKKKMFLTLNQILISFKNLSSMKILYIVIFIKGAGATLRSVIGNVTTKIE